MNLISIIKPACYFCYLIGKGTCNKYGDQITTEDFICHRWRPSSGEFCVGNDCPIRDLKGYSIRACLLDNSFKPCLFISIYFRNTTEFSNWE